ncbi:LAMI_0B04346g1_1 [Lachancea mirantina]|uniref:LAMI_0B04346g1_1 n=1 Tax=Lachancea mirantina TaxID=1230905 RepID=A0A1G4IVG4_9SACH|nr:LAMI_0B04346g1_1 [Lachancea mirantina]
MEQQIRDLETRYVGVYNDLINELDRIYLLRRKTAIQDEQLLAIRHQLQASLTMTIPLSKAASIGNESTDLDLRLHEMLVTGRQLDEQVIANQNQHLDQMTRLSQLRKEFFELRSETRCLVDVLRDRTHNMPSTPPEPTESVQNQSDVARQNERMKIVLTALIVQSGYQGTCTEIDEWLRICGG